MPKFDPILNEHIKYGQRFCRVPKWQNFTQSGHTVQDTSNRVFKKIRNYNSFFPFSVIFVFFSSHYQIQVKFQFQKRNLKINGVLGIRTRKHRRNHGAMGPPKLQILPSQFYFCLFYLIEVVNVCSTHLT